MEQSQLSEIITASLHAFQQEESLLAPNVGAFSAPFYDRSNKLCKPHMRLLNDKVSIMYHIEFSEKSCREIVEARMLDRSVGTILTFRNGDAAPEVGQDGYRLLDELRQRLVALGLLEDLCWENHI